MQVDVKPEWYCSGCKRRPAKAFGRFEWKWCWHCLLFDLKWIKLKQMSVMYELKGARYDGGPRHGS